MARNIELWRPQTLFRWEPFRELRRFEREMERMRENLMENLSLDIPEPALRRGFDFSPSCDLEETPSHFLVSMDLPGVTKDNVHIDLSDNQLKISGEKKKDRKEETPESYYHERHYGRFERVLNLGENIKPEKIEANFEDGVLRVLVPKKEEAMPKTTAIKIGEGKPSLWNRLIGKAEEKVEAAKKVA
ncbi:MAG: Hsp20/alpha crystallin family protein [Deltaproteobacteria bacterium]